MVGLADFCWLMMMYYKVRMNIQGVFNSLFFFMFKKYFKKNLNFFIFYFILN
jgi:hypothetical protein